jgi:hypothetical protein
MSSVFQGLFVETREVDAVDSRGFVIGVIEREVSTYYPQVRIYRVLRDYHSRRVCRREKFVCGREQPEAQVLYCGTVSANEVRRSLNWFLEPRVWPWERPRRVWCEVE